MTPNGVNIVHIIINDHRQIFDELIELLTDCFEQLGLSVKTTTKRFDADRLNLLVGHTAFLREREFNIIRQSLGKYVVFQMETLDPRALVGPDFASYLEILARADQVWDYSANNLPVLKAHGCKDVHYIPLGYSQRLERVPPAASKDIDILFYGFGNERRNFILDKLRQRGAAVESIFRVYGSQRDQFIARSKIVLNLHQFDVSHLEQVRLSYLLNNRSFVISETSDDNPYGQGVIYAPYDQIVECCLNYLQPEMAPRRTEIAEMGYANLKSLPMIQSVRSALARLD
jgi:hypothetical protein